MKNTALPWFVCAALVAVGCGSACAAGTAKTTPAPSAAPAETASQKSVFLMPKAATQGRDPFFPASSRLWAVTVKAVPSSQPAAPAVALVLNGLSGSSEHRLAMINGRTLAEGEESEINIAGVRVQVRCLEIKTDSVVVQAAGERRVLSFPHPELERHEVRADNSGPILGQK